MSIRRRTLLSLALGLLLTTTGCDRRERPSDSTGPHSSATHQARIVSLSPGVTDTLVAIGAQNELVAVSDYCNVAGLPRVGTAVTPTVEAIAAARPTLIVWSRLSGTQTSQLSRLASAVPLPWLTLNELENSTTRLGELTGHVTEARALAARLARELDVQPAPDAPRVLLLMGSLEMDSPEIWFIRRNSLHGRLLDGAGYRNAIDHDVTGPAKLSLEGLFDVDPDAIFILRDAEPDVAVERQLLARFAALGPLRAAKQQHLAVLSRPGSLSMGPRVLEWLPEIRRILDGLFDGGGNAHQ